MSGVQTSSESKLDIDNFGDQIIRGDMEEFVLTGGDSSSPALAKSNRIRGGEKCFSSIWIVYLGEPPVRHVIELMRTFSI